MTVHLSRLIGNKSAGKSQLVSIRVRTKDADDMPEQGVFSSSRPLLEMAVSAFH
jgi:hypothetical protein